jgi:hypothetical protein
MPEILTHPIAVKPTNILEPYVLRDVIVDGEGDVAIDIEYPPALSYLWPTVLLENVTIRGHWRVGIRLKHCWNATLMNVFVSGRVTEDTLRWPTMEVGIDCGNSMDVHILNPRVTCAEIGVRVQDIDLDGHGEGFHLHNGFLMNVGTGVKLEGFGSGGWPTPVAHVTGTHIAHNRVGIDARKYFAVHLSDVNFYGSEFSSYPLGLYAEDCRTLHVRDNEFWQNKPQPDGCAMAFTRCTKVRLRDNVVEPSYLADLVIDPGCTKVEYAENELNQRQVYDLR